jgi:hypothetical protein
MATGASGSAGKAARSAVHAGSWPLKSLVSLPAAEQREGSERIITASDFRTGFVEYMAHFSDVLVDQIDPDGTIDQPE